MNVKFKIKIWPQNKIHSEKAWTNWFLKPKVQEDIPVNVDRWDNQLKLSLSRGGVPEFELENELGLKQIKVD